jgi:anti-sigma B factor antagonist
MQLTADVQSGGETIFRPVGRIDLSSASEIKRRLADAVELGRPRLVVDLGDVPFIDSSGLGALISGLKVARAAGGYLRIARPNAQARLILELTTLHRVLTPYDSVEAALAADRAA